MEITAAQEAWLIKHYKHTKNAEVAAHLGISESMMHRIVRKLGLRKSPQFMRKCQAETTAAAKESHLRNGTFPPKGYAIPNRYTFPKGVSNVERFGKRVEERAQDFVSSGEYSPSLKECYIAGAAEEHLLLTHWNNVEVGKDGFTTNKAYAEITASVPILVKDIIFGEMFVIDKNNVTEWSADLYFHPDQYKWRKIHE